MRTVMLTNRRAGGEFMKRDKERVSPAVRSSARVPARGRRQQFRRARGLQGIYQSTGSALQALRANLLRSLLTSLGIIFGVGAVIIVIAISEGNTASINA